MNVFRHAPIVSCCVVGLGSDVNNMAQEKCIVGGADGKGPSGKQGGVDRPTQDEAKAVVVQAHTR